MGTQIYNEIYEEAFNDELKKIAGVGTEIAASVLQAPLSGIVGPISTLVSPRYTKEQLEKANRRILLNLIPGVAPARLGRRIKTALGGAKVKKPKKSKKK